MCVSCPVVLLQTVFELLTVEPVADAALSASLALSLQAQQTLYRPCNAGLVLVLALVTLDLSFWPGLGECRWKSLVFKLFVLSVQRSSLYSCRFVTFWSKKLLFII